MSPRILLLQDAVYLPSFGGGNKANRLLLADLAARGCECRAISRLPGERRLLGHQFGPAGLAARGVTVEADGSYCHQGVQVSPLDFAAPEVAAQIGAAIQDFQPDWILASDDRPALLLEAALSYDPARTVALIHTHFHLPFGPEADRRDERQHQRLREVRSVVAVSKHSRAYLFEHGGIEASVLHFPVFGAGPFPQGVPDGRFVAMINPCAAKGLPIFLALAARFPETPFAAVPTWGGEASVVEALSELPNTTILEPADDIGELLSQVRVLVAPSLVPETFGYVAIDAMVRGIPVLAGNLGGQPEAKLGIDHILPVAPLSGGEPQPIAAWEAALARLLSDPAAYRQLSETSREAASRFLPKTDASHFLAHLESLKRPFRAAPLPDRCRRTGG